METRSIVLIGAILALMVLSISHSKGSYIFLSESISKSNSIGNLTCTAGSTEIAGTVYEDYNYNGICDAGEDLGLSGILVIVTDESGNTASATTDATGTYSVVGLSPGENHRVEFVNIPDWAESTFSNTHNGTTVQFMQPGNCADLGLTTPSNFCQIDPTIGLACWQNGAGTTSTDPGFAYFPWDQNGATFSGDPDPNYGPDFSELGTTWGHAYQREDEQSYLATVTRRHAGQGPTGEGGIYVLDNTGNLLGSFDLQGVVPDNGGTALDFGTLNRIVVPGAIGNSTSGDFDLSEDPFQSTRDLDAFAKVGTTSYGDIDFSDDGVTLWATNLNSRELISINTSDPANPLPLDGSQPSSELINRYDITTLPGLPTCTNGEFRPWALEFKKGVGYLGGVCSGENGGDIDDVQSYVLAFDPDNVAAGFTTALTFPMDYTRETVSSFFDPDLIGDWSAWNNDGNNVLYQEEYVNQGAPILTDIVFDKDCDMTIGFIDRESLQFGVDQFEPVSGSGFRVDREGGGDILHSCFINGGWVLENGTSCDGITDPGNMTNGSLANDGPSGVGEYYYGDYYEHRNDFSHDEIVHGGLVYSCANDEIIVNAYDPVHQGDGGTTNTQGVITFSSDGGDKVDAFQFSNINEIGKSAALGDLEAYCEAAPIEIGNYVWIDTDGDGVQDPEEAPVPGVTMELYDAVGNLLATTVTDANGEYYFSSDATDVATWVTSGDGLDYSTAYYIVAGGNGQYSGGVIDIGGTDYELTTPNTSNIPNADAIDSDGTIAMGVDPDFEGEPHVLIMTGNAGQVDHTFDFGFREACPTENCYDIIITRND